MSQKQTAVVVGGGPAGLSSALGLLRSGLDVAVLDQRTKWLGRVCGSFLNAESIAHLKWLGVWNEVLKKNPVLVPRAIVTCGSTSASTPTMQNQTMAMGLPRKDLEEVLSDAIHKAGGKIHIGARVVQTKKETHGWIVTTNSSRFQTDWLIHADGRFSGAIPNSSDKSIQGWYGWNATFENVNQRPGELSLHLYSGGYVGVLTFADGSTNVCGLVHRRAKEPLLWDAVFETALNANAFFSKIMEDADQKTEWQGVGPLPFSTAMRHGIGSFLAGDAAAVGDPFMGEGIGRALGAGPMLHHALTTNEPLSVYNAFWEKTYSKRLRTGGWLRQALINRPLLPPMTMAFFSQPWLLKWATRRFHVGYNVTQPEPLATHQQ